VWRLCRGVISARHAAGASRQAGRQTDSEKFGLNPNCQWLPPNCACDVAGASALRPTSARSSGCLNGSHVTNAIANKKLGLLFARTKAWVLCY
jgi:hypothetical protein